MTYKNIKILHEDKDLIVLNKPAGLTVHPGAGKEKITLVNFLQSYCGKNLSNLSGLDRPGIVHRLDKDTSGLMLVAKNNITHENISRQFKKKTIDKFLNLNKITIKKTAYWYLLESSENE